MTTGRTTRVIEIGQDLPSLHFRRKLAQDAIRVLDMITDKELESMHSTDEERKKSIEKYKGQLANIDQKITDITGSPPPVVVGLKTAKLLVGDADMKKRS